MEYKAEKLAELNTRLLLSRARILTRHSFFGLLLMHMRYAIDPASDTAYTDGDKIAFGMEFLEDLSDSELDFVMMHEVLHVALLHCTRGKELDATAYNIACDIVVNSNILKSSEMDTSSITLKKYGTSMHLTPSGKEGFLYTAEEVYRELMSKVKRSSSAKTSSKEKSSEEGKRKGRTSSDKGSPSENKEGWDEHGKWKKDTNGIEEEIWIKRISDAARISEASGSASSVPFAVTRALDELSQPVIDWKAVLSEFIEKEITDFSFSPPDRRFSDTPFLLPDFNDTADRIENLLFMVDTSASVSDEAVTKAYSEIAGALERFDGKLSGSVGFFDTEVYEPKPFDSIEDLMAIKPKGGGGTSFHSVFRYIRRHMEDNPPYCIIILTDGEASFPEESAAMGIPVLWIMTGDIEAPFGKCIKLE